MDRLTIKFPIEQDEDGYPPITDESVWAQPTTSGAFLIDTIPFFATDATLGDEVNAEQIDGELFYVSTSEPSGNSLLRVVFFDAAFVEDLRRQLNELGCSSELSHVDCLIAVNVPQSASLREVQQLLNAGCDKGQWDYEEPILRR